MKKQGFSLIEILVVLGVFALLATFATQAILLTLRGSRKSESSIKVKENLTYAMSVMERQIRNAASVTVPCTGNRVDYTDNSNNASYFACLNSADDPYFIASGSSARLTSNEILVNPCTITCSATSVSINLTGKSVYATGVENTTETISSTVFLRQ